MRGGNREASGAASARRCCAQHRRADAAPLANELQPEKKCGPTNYLTRELLDRFGSADPAVASAAGGEWEKALEHYEQRWHAIRPQVPVGAAYLTDHFYLHDAAVRSLGR